MEFHAMIKKLSLYLEYFFDEQLIIFKQIKNLIQNLFYLESVQYLLNL